jgi:hypothetical protein
MELLPDASRLPVPQPNAWGNSRQGHPVRRTTRMPPRAAPRGREGGLIWAWVAP